LSKIKNLYDRLPNEQETKSFAWNEETIMNESQCETCEIVSKSLGMAQLNVIKHMRKGDSSKQEIRQFCNDSLELLLKQVN
jgi:hypothetical protein